MYPTVSLRVMVGCSGTFSMGSRPASAGDRRAKTNTAPPATNPRSPSAKTVGRHPNHATATASGVVEKIAPSPATPAVKPVIIPNSSVRNQFALNRKMEMKMTPLPRPVSARERNARRYPLLIVNPIAPTLNTNAPPAPM